MTTIDKSNTFASRGNARLVKLKIQQLNQNRRLLKNKSNALEMIIRDYLRLMKQIQNDITIYLTNGYIQLMRGKFLKFNYNIVLLLRPLEANLQLKKSVENIMGTIILKFDINNEIKTNNDLIFRYYGLSSGHLCVQNIKKIFRYLIELYIKLANCQNLIKLLTETCKNLRRRINAFEYVLIPNLQSTLKYIEDELDEREREDYYRFKKIKYMKEKNKLENNDDNQRTEKDKCIVIFRDMDKLSRVYKFKQKLPLKLEKMDEGTQTDTYYNDMAIQVPSNEFEFE